MSPNPSRASTAGRAYLGLQALSRSSGRATDELLQLYALEGFLARLTRSPYRHNLVLKGGVLLAAFEARRPTRDIDLRAHAVSTQLDTARALVVQIAALDIDDGLVFDPESARAAAIRDEEDYHGARVSLRGQLDRARIAFHIDLNVGDPIEPPAREVALPRLLGGEPIMMAGYPLVMVLAEKLVTAVQRGETNTRWRDYADLYRLTRQHDVDGAELFTAINHVTAHRQAQLLPLQEVLADYAELAQPRWQAWRQRHEPDTLPVQFATVLNHVTRFADPILTAPSPPNIEWRAATGWQRHHEHGPRE